MREYIIKLFLRQRDFKVLKSFAKGVKERECVSDFNFGKTIQMLVKMYTGGNEITQGLMKGCGLLN